ncbi:MAG TPA: M28 family peptidase [candidate division Zixibacteria bacterium]|nr:M28 family peptidase [candidate division Zixibacteria bacterium]
MRYRTLGLCLLILFVAIGGCSGDLTKTPEFDGQRAYQYLVDQVGFGPRVPGTEASAKCRDYLYRFFDSLKIAVDSQEFNFFDPYSAREIRMVNIIASVTPIGTDTRSRVLLMAHYDSRPRAEHSVDPAMQERPIDGANDGASGVAVLMELANLFAAKPPAIGIDIALVDGEDWGKESDHDLYMLGSREFARHNIRNRYKYGIVVDMVGDKDQNIYKEAYSEMYAAKLNDLVFATAAKLGVHTFIDSVKYTIQDDHLSLITAGVPSVDIIDFDYPYWHTVQDTSDKCSGESLANVGRVLATILYSGRESIE